MYHYVSDDNAGPPFGYYHLDLADFRLQLNHFQDEFYILDQDAFLSTLRGNRAPRKDDLILTFDDGLRCHFEKVLPELVERKLWGLFYVSSGPYLETSVLDVHRIHALLGEHGGEVVAGHLADLLAESMVSTEHRNRFSDVVYADQENIDSVLHVKRLLNFDVDVDVRDDVLDSLERRLFDAPLRASDVYMTREEIRELAASGMHVGAHASTHTVMSKLRREDQEREITRSFGFLRDTLGEVHFLSYCHPYGGSHSYTEDTLELLKKAGCSFAFDVDSRPITETVIADERLTLPRYDCNKFLHGSAKASLG
jgi:peptidoglycan/xylan/chitin deacetylase (PgdA/CDA1 family)